MNNTTIANETDNFGQNEFDDEIELRRLARSVSLAEKYFLFFASCNQLPKQKILVKEIKAKLPDKKIEVVEFKKPILNLLDELRKRLKNKKPDAVIVLGLRYSIPSAKKETPFIANLNISRDDFPKVLSCPLIIWLPEYAANKIMNDAHDFFSVRSSIFYFETDTKLLNQQISQSTSVGYDEIQALHVEERQQRLANLEEMLAEYESLPKNKRDYETERQLKNKLADIYFVSADYAKAEKFRKELLETEKDKESVDYTVRLDDLARVYYHQSRYPEAIELNLEVLKIAEKTVGKESADYAIYLNELARVYDSQGRFEEAIELYQEVLKIAEKTVGTEHSHYATYLNNLARVYDSQGRYDEAIELYKKVTEIDEKTIGKEHPDYAIHLSNLANVFHEQGKYTEAIELFKEALLVQEKTVGKEHPNYTTHMINLATVYENQGKYQDALDLYEQVLRIDEKTLPENHPYTQQDRESIARCRMMLGK